jgi:hypothetical protein
MDTAVLSLSRQPNYSSAFRNPLSLEELRERVPAAFATAAHERTSQAYTFISTQQVLAALNEAGFLPVEARQASKRVASPLHARHLIRLRQRVQTIQLRDSIGEILLLNSHDGSGAYTLRAGVFRVVCLNGLVASAGDFPIWRVAHRGDVVADVVQGALEISQRFGLLAASVERMEGTQLEAEQRLGFAAEALALRFTDAVQAGLRASQLLEPRRLEDVGNDLWRTFNTVQSNLLGGGLLRRSASGRLTRTRPIRAIQRDLELNSKLWDLAIARAA